MKLRKTTNKLTKKSRYYYFHRYYNRFIRISKKDFKEELSDGRENFIVYFNIRDSKHFRYDEYRII